MFLQICIIYLILKQNKINENCIQVSIKNVNQYDY